MWGAPRPTREGASAFRKLLAQGNQTLDALNKEYGFWKGLKTVLTETERRTQGQSSGLSSVVLGGSGATAGAFVGDSPSDRVQNAIIGGIAARQLTKVMQSAAWRTKVSAPLKAMLADALSSGSASRIESASKTILRSIPAAYRPSEDE